MSKIYYSSFYPDTNPGILGSTIPGLTPSLDIPPTQVFYADYTGTVSSDQLPIDVPIIRRLGDIDISANSTWSIISSYNCTATIDSSTGIITISAIVDTGSVTISSLYANLELRGTLEISKITGTPPTGNDSGTGTTASTSSISSTSSSSYGDSNIATLAITCGSSGNINLSAPLSFRTNSNAITNWGSYGKWQYRLQGSSTWIDVGTEIYCSTPASTEDYDTR